MGVMMRWMTSASMVSAKMAPITKAPKAVENPAKSAKTTMPKQSPTATMHSVSSDIHLRIQRKKEGMRKMPKVNHTMRKKISLTMLMPSWAPSNRRLTLRVERITNSNTATRSSTTSTAVTVLVNFCCLSFKSSNDLMMMVVDEMDSIHPRKMQLMSLMPKIWPIVLPITNMIANSVNAVTAPVAPTFFSFLMLNSNPKANIKKTIPMSLQTWMLVSSLMAGNHGK